MPLRLSSRCLALLLAATLAGGCNSPTDIDAEPIAFHIIELRGTAGQFAATVRVVNAGALAARIDLCESFERKSPTGWSLVTYGDFQCLDAYAGVNASASYTVSIDGLAVAKGDTIRFAPRYTLGSATRAPSRPSRGAVSPAIVVR
ncbi:MAG: hypothetical protein ABIS00_14595 [Gemmatimonadales bacterium]